MLKLLISLFFIVTSSASFASIKCETSKSIGPGNKVEGSLGAQLACEIKAKTFLTKLYVTQEVLDDLRKTRYEVFVNEQWDTSFKGNIYKEVRLDSALAAINAQAVLRQSDREYILTRTTSFAHTEVLYFLR